MTSERECLVYVVLPGATSFVTAGRFRVTTGPTGDSAGAFVYGRRYRERPDAVELDPVELRLSSRVHETARLGGFFGAIRDAMPDAWGRLVIDRRAGVTESDEFDYLLQGPDDRAGALGFGVRVEPPSPVGQSVRGSDLDRLRRAAEAVVAGRPARAGPSGRLVEELLFPGTSLGGARPKAVVEEDGILWIAKFPRRNDRWNHPRVEHGMLALARAAGLRTADSRRETVAGRDVLLVRRFDRDGAEDGWRRHRMVSALTLLRAGDGVGDRREWSYLALADEIRRCSANPRADLRELFGRMCFNAAVSNLDDHPRNHAIVAVGHRWRLSPAYDLTPSPVISRERRDLAMTCGRLGRHAARDADEGWPGDARRPGRHAAAEGGALPRARHEALPRGHRGVGGVRRRAARTRRRAAASHGPLGAPRRDAARLGRWEFLLVIAPLRVPGGTGSPVNPIAVF